MFLFFIFQAIKMKLAFSLVILISLTVDGTPFGSKQNENNLPIECQFINLPNSIENFYDKILSNPGTHGQNLSLIRETVADDWNNRPNQLNPSKGIGAGPFPEGLKKLMGAFSTMLKDVTFTRKETSILKQLHLNLAQAELVKMYEEVPGNYNETDKKFWNVMKLFGIEYRSEPEEDTRTTKTHTKKKHNTTEKQKNQTKNADKKMMTKKKNKKMK